MEKKTLKQVFPNTKIDVTSKMLREYRNLAILNGYAPIDYITKLNIEWPFASITYCPLSDLHAGNVNARIDLFDKWIKFMETTYNAVTILNGDIFDYPTQTSISNTHDEVLPPEDVIEQLYKKLLPLAKQGKILAITPGNHDSKNSKRGVDTNVSVLKSLAQKLNVPFIEHNVVAEFHMPIEAGNEKFTYTVAAMHGAGKAGGVAGALDAGKQQMDRVFKIYQNKIDLFDFGHFHQGGNLYYRYEMPEKNKNNRTIRTTSEESVFLSNYSFQDNSDYAAEANFGPAEVNSWIVFVKPEPNVYYKSNIHENNKFVAKHNIFKMFTPSGNLALPSQLLNQKYFDKSLEIENALSLKYANTKASSVLATAEQQGGLGKWVKHQIHIHLKKRKSL